MLDATYSKLNFKCSQLLVNQIVRETSKGTQNVSENQGILSEASKSILSEYFESWNAEPGSSWAAWFVRRAWEYKWMLEY